MTEQTDVALAIMRDGVAAVIAERGAGDFAPLLPKLRNLLDLVDAGLDASVTEG
jgi:hypothetical protein